MESDVVARLKQDGRYHELVAQRTRFGWILSIATFAAFVGFIMLVAFDKSLLAAPIGSGVTSIGIPLGLGLIVLAILLTGIYVARANRIYDRKMAEILAEAVK